ncbi:MULTISPECIES: alpha-amylase family glycosyl hydrolase [unclassified Nocardia]|uniref:alpha-amylase family glycosyl hydrolase n=1 Tax=unclassified Nocardia TaxID=2637762 RepID=UPI001CE4546A|nr:MULTISPECIES: alpha-amylase family glycosyl hydrolase [unclassified Nocardia]
MGWWRDAVFYQIYPRSFADSDGDGVGDLPGIIGRLAHLRDLGVDAVWLSPCYRSPMVDFGYDISDYRDIDPLFGTLRDFDELLSAAHGMGLRVVLDLVANHTSDRHPWFQESRSARDAPRRDWYVWADPAEDGGPPNNWLSAFPDTGTAWTFDEATGQYYLHSFTRNQPDLNWWNPAVRQAMTEVMRFWLDRGVDGFRFDVPHRLIKDRALQDNPPDVAHLRKATGAPPGRQRHIDRPEVHEVLRVLRAVLDDYPDRVAVGEVGVTDSGRLTAYYGDDDELNLLFNFAFWSQPWSANGFRDAVAVVEATTPPHAWPTYALSNHDLPRAAHRYAADGHGPARARLAAMMLLTLRGTPFLYYGEEIGMTDVPVPAERAHDPDGRDGCRAPMLWNANRHAGFTLGTPWLPIAADAPAINVAVQRARPDSLLNLYRKLLALRRTHPALTEGAYRVADFGDDRVFAYHRETGDERLLVALNFAATSVTAPMALDDARLLCSTHPGSTGSDDLRLGPHEGIIVSIG